MKLNQAIKKHLLKIAEGFAKDQRCNSEKQREAKFKILKEQYIKKTVTKELKDIYKKRKKLKEECVKVESELTTKSEKLGLDWNSEGFCTSYAKKNEIYAKIEQNASVQWDVILSTVALKLELCNTYEEAKQLIEDVTGANVDTMITTIIPPNMQLTNNN